MKIFGVIVGCLSIFCFAILPGIDEYNKYKTNSKKEALLHFFVPLLVYIGLVIAGFILYEIIPRLGAKLIESLF